MLLRSISRLIVLLCATALITALPCAAQQPPSGTSSSTNGPGIEDPEATNGAQDESHQSDTTPKPIQRPYAVDPAGPAITLETNEGLFTIAAGMNACGYDAGLESSDPVRRAIRDELNAIFAAKADARDERDALCEFFRTHRIGDAGRDLAQYVSLAMYLTPQLTLSVEEGDMPPDANAVANLLPLLQGFARATEMHLLWLKHRPEYEALTARLHNPLTHMILETNVYLKQPYSSYDGRKFLVLLEPLLSPTETNARIYGTDYILVTSPVAQKPNDPPDAMVRLDQIRHIYLHYEVEPLIYARAPAIIRITPILSTVQDAPLEFVYKNDIMAMLTECLIKAIEARTMGIPGEKPPDPASKGHADQEAYLAAIQSYDKRAEQYRRAQVERDMREGFVLAHYFYQEMEHFEHGYTGINEAVGEMVYSIDVDFEKHVAQRVVFSTQGSVDPLRRTMPRSAPTGLDLAELKLAHGDVDAAAALAQQALDQHTGDQGRAHFLMARIESREGLMDDAVASYQAAIAQSHDPRTIAWSHIYMGRIDDIRDERAKALAEYNAALATRDARPDTKAAAERGLKQPFSVPKRTDDDASLDPTGKAEKESYQPQPIQVPAQKH